MRDAVLPAMLACAAFALFVARSGRRKHGVATLLIVGVVATIASMLLPSLHGSGGLQVGAWIVVAALALSVILVPTRRTTLAASLAAGVGTGFVTGAVVASNGGMTDLVACLSGLLAWAPATLLVKKRPIILQVLAGWMIAISLLSVTLIAVQGPVAPADHVD